MKSKFLLVFFVLLLVSCKKETAVKDSAYPQIIVGTARGKTFVVANATIIKPEWEKALKQKGNKSGITSLEIVQGTTEGDTVKEFYMIVAKCTDGRTIMAALLVKKGAEFYFDKESPVSIICSGECAGGCLPHASFKDGVVALMCSSCADCIKTDYSINFH